MASVRDTVDRAFDIGAYAVSVVVLSTLSVWCAAIVGGATLGLIDHAIIDGSGHADRDRKATASQTSDAGHSDHKTAALAIVALPDNLPFASSSTAQPAAARRLPIPNPEDDPAAAFHDGDDDTYRTFCVRLCDGYFWPVSFSTTSDRFPRDQAACASSCNSPAKLFVHKMPGGGPATMMSLEGLPYAALKTAFLFRTTYDSQCKCQAQPWEQQAQDRHRLYVAAEATRKGSKIAASEVRILTGRLEAARLQDAKSLAAANERLNQELTVLARGPLARTLVEEVAGKRRRSSSGKSDRFADARRPDATAMRLGGAVERQGQARWIPASGRNVYWKDRVFNGN